MFKEGYAKMWSNSDPRWNYECDCICGGFVMPTELENKKQEFIKLYGEPPEDLEWSYMKY